MKLMKPKKVDDILLGDKFIYEVKFDGGSAEIKKHGKEIEILHTDNNTPQNYKYPELFKELSSIKDGHYVAELIVANCEYPGGHFPFYLKRQCENKFLIQKRTKSYPITAMIYDIISDNSESCINEKLLERKHMLEQNIHNSQHIKLVEYYDEPAPVTAKKDCLEGVVIKEKESLYRFDSRDGWYKYRFNKEETVKCVSCEDWESEDGILRGIVMTTDDGKRVNLAGDRSDVARQKIADQGFVMVELSYNGKSDKGFRFTTVKRVI